MDLLTPTRAVENQRAVVQLHASCLRVAHLVHNARSDLLVTHNWRLGIRVGLTVDPHAGEGGEGGQDGPTNPDRDHALWRSDDLTLGGLRHKALQLGLETLRHVGEHGGTTRHDNVLEEVLADIEVAVVDSLFGELVETHHLLTIEGRLEHELRATDHLVVDSHNLAVRHLELLLLTGEVVDLLGEVLGDVAKVLLDLLGGLALGGGGEHDFGLLEDLADVVGEVATSEVDALDGMGHGVTLVDRDGVGHTITAIHDDTSGTARGVQGEHGLDVDVVATHVEGLEHDLGHALTVVLRVHRSLGEQDTAAVLIGLVVITDDHTELIVESVAPHLLHVVPVLDDTVLERVLEDEDTALLLGLLTDVVVLVGTDEGGLLLWVADHGGEGHLRGVLTGATGLHHTGTVVNDNGWLLLIFIHHVCVLVLPM